MNSQAENWRIREFIDATGRGPTQLELSGAQQPGCPGCARLAWACLAHQRKTGDPIPLPDRSEWNRNPRPAGAAPYHPT